MTDKRVEALTSATHGGKNTLLSLNLFLILGLHCVHEEIITRFTFTQQKAKKETTTFTANRFFGSTNQVNTVNNF